MGLLSRLRHATPARHQDSPSPAPAGGFAVLDLETTGFSPARDRIVEVAVIHVDATGRLGERWTSLVHPGRASTGPEHVHGISPDDVRGAPRFEHLADTLVALLAGRVLVAHNAAFDVPFLRTELARAGVSAPHVPHLCTLEHSHHHLPHLGRRRLADCCAAAGVDLDGAHAALADATATAGLLAWYLRAPTATASGTDALLRSAAQLAWPQRSGPAVPAPPGLRIPLPRAALDDRAARAQPAAPGRLAALLAELPLDSSDLPLPEAAGYLELLATAMADGVLTDAEVEQLVEAAHRSGLTRAQVHAAHRGTLLALARAAVADGVLSRAERADLTATAAALGLDAAEVTSVLGDARTERAGELSASTTALPDGWTAGEPLHVGDAVAFTGGGAERRAALERRARDAGLRVTSAVSRRTAALVTDDAHSGTGKARTALELGTRIVDLRTFEVLVGHVQAAEGAR